MALQAQEFIRKWQAGSPAHEALDAAAAAAYGWDEYTSSMADDETLQRLLALSLERVSASVP